MIQSSSLFEKFLQGKFSLHRDLEISVEELQKEVKTINQLKENSFYERSKSLSTNQMQKKIGSGSNLHHTSTTLFERRRKSDRQQVRNKRLSLNESI